MIAPCGFKPSRAALEIDSVTRLEGWNELLAVKNNAAYLADATLFTQPSTDLINGIELLAGLFHPELFKVPAALKDAYIPLENIHA